MAFIVITLFCLAPVALSFSAKEVSDDLLNQCPPLTFNDAALLMKEELIGDDLLNRKLSFWCKNGFYLVGSPSFECVEGTWTDKTGPRCIPYCQVPPYMHNGIFRVDGWKNANKYPNGTTVAYSCNDKYDIYPRESSQRMCINGRWSGITGQCFYSNCEPYKEELVNGVVNHEKESRYRVLFRCNNGYKLAGPPQMECIPGGYWVPQVTPRCVKLAHGEDENDPLSQDTPIIPGKAVRIHTGRETEEEAIVTSNVEVGRPCAPPPAIHGTIVERVRGMVTANTAMAGSEIEIRCEEGLRDVENPCEPTLLHCINGMWRGRHPTCVPFSSCMPLPGIPHGALFGLAPDGLYRVGARVAYTCQPGFRLHGQPVFSCENNGCWAPALLPECLPDDQPFYLSGLRNWEEYALSPGAALLASLATALAVMALLLAVCMAVVCRRRRRSSGRHTGASSGARAQRLHWPDQSPEQPPQLPPSLLPPDPDRVALIAFADGLQVGQSVLPSYEEATRERGTGVLYGALHRSGRGPHWTALASSGGGGRRARRERHQQQQDGDTVSHHSLHGGLCTRQSSSTSHSASLRSYAVGGAGESMGSTDTVAAGSEGSTTVTLDTVSSHTSSLASGGPGSACSSQTASCRAICGSLASFDTSSVLNTEGVPLLEESELEGAAEARADEDTPATSTPAPPANNSTTPVVSAESKLRGASPDHA